MTVLHNPGIEPGAVRTPSVHSSPPSTTPRLIATAATGALLGIVGVHLSGISADALAIFVLGVVSVFVVIARGEVRRPLLALIVLDIPFQLDANLSFRSDVAARGALGGLNVSVTTAALVILYALWFAELLARGRPVPRRLIRQSWPFALFFGSVALSAGVASDRQLSIFALMLLAQMFLLYIYIAGTVRTRRDVRFIVTLLCVGLLAQSVIMLGVYVTGRNIEVAGFSTTVDASFGARAAGTLRSPNSAASFLMMLLPVALALLLTRPNAARAWLAAAAFGLGSVALMLTLSRGAWLAFGIAASLMGRAAWRRGGLSAKAPLALCAILAVLMLVLNRVILSRLLSDDGGSAQGRLPLMALAFRMIDHNPLRGIGANNFATVIKQYATPEFNSEWLYTVHNQYLLVWAETGLGGLLSFLLLLGAVIVRGWRTWRLHDRLASPVGLSLACAAIGHMAHMQVDFFNQRPQVQLLWFTAGLVTALPGVVREEPYHG